MSDAQGIAIYLAGFVVLVLLMMGGVVLVASPLDRTCICEDGDRLPQIELSLKGM